MQTINIYTDGASRNNPGHSGIGVIAYHSESNQILFTFKDYIGIKTNNEAEYLAVIQALRICNEKSLQDLCFFSDSQLIVEQINGNYKVKQEHLKKLVMQVHALKNNLHTTFNYIPREKNKEADALANQGINDFLVKQPNE